MIAAEAVRPLLMRELLGESLRELRTADQRTLREVSSAARVSLGYLSEIERGQKGVEIHAKNVSTEGSIFFKSTQRVKTKE